mmetsp:Transcript_41967/g.98538  ORF Transcript_41967/g.98538 Transcript_41967/m.98538 type:complete len:143 (-) Transcript_41967:968-1396(-)
MDQAQQGFGNQMQQQAQGFGNQLQQQAQGQIETGPFPVHPGFSSQDQVGQFGNPMDQAQQGFGNQAQQQFGAPQAEPMSFQQHQPTSFATPPRTAPMSQLVSPTNMDGTSGYAHFSPQMSPLSPGQAPNRPLLFQSQGGRQI